MGCNGLLEISAELCKERAEFFSVLVVVRA